MAAAIADLSPREQCIAVRAAIRADNRITVTRTRGFLRWVITPKIQDAINILLDEAYPSAGNPSINDSASPYDGPDNG